MSLGSLMQVIRTCTKIHIVVGKTVGEERNEVFSCSVMEREGSRRISPLAGLCPNC